MSQSLTFSSSSIFYQIKGRVFAQILCGSLLLALCAQIAIFLPFSPVPMTMQTFGVMLLGCLLGRKKAAASVILYLIEGTCGLPVFAGGVINSLALFGPRAGYLFGMIAQAYFSGLLYDMKIPARSIKGVSLLFFASFLQLAIGTLGLAPFTGWNAVLALGFYPFVIPALLKVAAISAFIAPRKQ